MRKHGKDGRGGKTIEIKTYINSFLKDFSHNILSLRFLRFNLLSAVVGDIFLRKKGIIKKMV